MTRDLHTSYTEPRTLRGMHVQEHWAWAGFFQNSWRGAAVEVDAIRELQLNRGAAVEVDAIGEQQLKRTQSRAAAEADASSEHAAAEADANGEQQLKRIDAIAWGAAH